ncbi:MAG: hypothetical protein V4462_05260 [Pseudomonadota bacterium]
MRISVQTYSQKLAQNSASAATVSQALREKRDMVLLVLLAVVVILVVGGAPCHRRWAGGRAS